MASSKHDLENVDDKRSLSQSLLRWAMYGIIGIFLFESVLLVRLIFFQTGDSQLLEGASSIENALGWLLATLFCASRFPYTHYKQRSFASQQQAIHTARYNIPFWVGLAFFINAIGSSIYAFYYLHDINPVTLWPASIRLAQYPCLLLAIASLPTRPLPSMVRLRVGLDSLLIITTLSTFSWYFLLGPSIVHTHATTLNIVLGTAYPIGDVVLCYCLLRLTFHRTAPHFHVARVLLLCGLILIIVTDCIRELRLMQILFVADFAGSLILAVGYVLIALAVQAVFKVTQRQPEQIIEQQTVSEEISSFWLALLPSISIPAVVGLMIIVWYIGKDDLLAEGVYLGGFALIFQVLLRQALVLRESFFYTHQLQRMQQQLSTNNTRLNEANQRLEEQARELTAAYDQQRRVNEIKEQLLLNINHELRTPLTAVHGYLELLATFQGNLSESQHTRFISQALHSSQELLRLVDTVLDALRSDQAKNTIHWEKLPLASVVQDVLELFEPEKQQAYILKVAISDELIVLADQQYLHQILCNLLSNAFKYSPTATVIEIGAQYTAETLQQIDHYICIWVQDRGPGIPPADIPLLFGKFVRLQRDLLSTVRGTGLGLYICKQLVEAMGGNIWVESSGVPGEGSRFCFTLPVARQEQQILPPTAPQLHSTIG